MANVVQRLERRVVVPKTRVRLPSFAPFTLFELFKLTNCKFGVLRLYLSIMSSTSKNKVNKKHIPKKSKVLLSANSKKVTSEFRKLRRTIFITNFAFFAFFVSVFAISSSLQRKSPSLAGADPVVVVAGDIACSFSTTPNATGKTCFQKATSDLALSLNPSLAIQLGDNQYDNGEYSKYKTYYGPSWGRAGLVNISKPIPGNHEYHTAGGSGYYQYFKEKGISFGQNSNGYYSYNIGSWHMIALNTEVARGAGSAQETWLKNDLASNPTSCTIAYTHKPRFSSGSEHGSDASLQNIWAILANAKVDILLSAHDHHYERFFPMNASSGRDDANGMVQFVVGTGGTGARTLGTVRPNSAVRKGLTYGVMKLTLHATSYEWQYLPISGFSGSDSGSANCVGIKSSPPPAPAPSQPAPATNPDLIVTALGWSPSNTTTSTNITFYATIKNQGNARAYNLTNKFYVNGSPVSSWTGGGTTLDPGASITFAATSGTWRPTSAGSVTITSKTNDPQTTTNESNTGNNTFDRVMVVTTAPIAPTSSPQSPTTPQGSTNPPDADPSSESLVSETVETVSGSFGLGDQQGPSESKIKVSIEKNNGVLGETKSGFNLKNPKVKVASLILAILTGLITPAIIFIVIKSRMNKTRWFQQHGFRA